jgi:hypothetical protein
MSQLGYKDLGRVPIYLGQGQGQGTDATDLAHVRKMEKDAKQVLESLRNERRTKNYYYETHQRLNELQEERYRRFAAKRWSVDKFLGAKHHRKAIAKIEE